MLTYGLDSAMLRVSVARFLLYRLRLRLFHQRAEIKEPTKSSKLPIPNGEEVRRAEVDQVARFGVLPESATATLRSARQR
jgi:hypothetical protein